MFFRTELGHVGIRYSKTAHRSTGSPPAVPGRRNGPCRRSGWMPSPSTWIWQDLGGPCPHAFGRVRARSSWVDPRKSDGGIKGKAKRNIAHLLIDGRFKKGGSLYCRKMYRSFTSGAAESWSESWKAPLKKKKRLFAVIRQTPFVRLSLYASGLVWNAGIVLRHLLISYVQICTHPEASNGVALV